MGTRPHGALSVVAVNAMGNLEKARLREGIGPFILVIARHRLTHNRRKPTSQNSTYFEWPLSARQLLRRLGNRLRVFDLPS